MPRTTIVIVAVVAAALGAAGVLLVWRSLDDRPPIQTEALGVWQESTESLPVRLTVSAAGEDPATAGYWVTYPSMSDVPYPARLDGDRILVMGADGGDALVGDPVRRRRGCADRPQHRRWRDEHPASRLEVVAHVRGGAAPRGDNWDRVELDGGRDDLLPVWQRQACLGGPHEPERQVSGAWDARGSSSRPSSPSSSSPWSGCRRCASGTPWTTCASGRRSRQTVRCPWTSGSRTPSTATSRGSSATSRSAPGRRRSSSRA